MLRLVALLVSLSAAVCATGTVAMPMESVVPLDCCTVSSQSDALGLLWPVLIGLAMLTLLAPQLRFFAEHGRSIMQFVFRLEVPTQVCLRC